MRSHSKALLGLIATAFLCGCSHMDSGRIVSEVTGRISAIHIQADSRVHTGDVLIQLDVRDLITTRDGLMARIDLAELRQTDTSALYFELEQTKRDLSRLTITAPSDGQITWITPLHVGEVLLCGQVVALIRR